MERQDDISKMCLDKWWRNSIKPDVDPRQRAQLDDDLITKLNHRNELLDQIRVAYHRDVVLVKEALYQLRQNKELKFDRGTAILASDDSSAPGSRRAQSRRKQDKSQKEIYEWFQSIPSIDIRPVLRLYSPEECEVHLKPCSSCGGTIDIVHREHACFVRLRKVLEDTEEREIKLINKVTFKSFPKVLQTNKFLFNIYPGFSILISAKGWRLTYLFVVQNWQIQRKMQRECKLYFPVN